MKKKVIISNLIAVLAIAGVAQADNAEQEKFQTLWGSVDDARYQAAAVSTAVRVGATIARVATRVAPAVLRQGSAAVKFGNGLARKASTAVRVASRVSNELSNLQRSNQVSQANSAIAFTSDVVEENSDNQPAEAKVENSKPESVQQAKALAKQTADAERDYLLNMEQKKILDKRLLDALNKLDKGEQVDLTKVTEGLDQEASANLASVKQKLASRAGKNPAAVNAENIQRSSQNEDKAADSLDKTVEAGEKLIANIDQIAQKKEGNDSIDDLLQPLTEDADNFEKECNDDYLIKDELLSAENEDFGNIFALDGDIDPSGLLAG